MTKFLTISLISIHIGFLYSGAPSADNTSLFKYRCWGNPFANFNDLYALGVSPSALSEALVGNWQPPANFVASLTFLSEDQVLQNNDPNNNPPPTDKTAHDGRLQNGGQAGNYWRGIAYTALHKMDGAMNSLQISTRSPSSMALGACALKADPHHSGGIKIFDGPDGNLAYALRIIMVEEGF
ncbi:MAG TPA: hypothetical protein VG722_02790 [Tepidisphaeraceae bacterium]|nr:hypothetical protein [Tepidisphaeraceae bacterium]